MLETVLATAYHGLGTLAVLLSPVMPESTEKLWVALGAGVVAVALSIALAAGLGRRQP